MAYINGNLALQPKRKPDQKPSFRETKHVLVKRKSIPMQEKLLYMFTVVVCVIVAGVIIFRYAQIYDMSTQIKQMTNEYETMNVELKELKKQVEMLSDPERIREMAVQQGMTSTDQPDITVNTGTDNTQSAMRE